MLVFTTVCSYFCSLRRHFGNTWQFWRADTTRLAGESNRQEGKKYRERRWETTGMTNGRREWGRGGGVWKRVWSVRRNTIFDKPICYLHAASLLFLWTKSPHTLTTQPETKARFELTPHNLRGHGDKRVIAAPLGRPMKHGIDTSRPSPSCKNTHLFVCLCVWSITSLYAWDHSWHSEPGIHICPDPHFRAGDLSKFMIEMFAW